MLIVGTGGLAKDLVGSLVWDFRHVDFHFYNDISKESLFVNKYTVLHNEEQAKEYFKNKDNRFNVAIGNPLMRERVCKRFRALGGILTTIKPYFSRVSEFSKIAEGCIFQPDVIISSCVEIQEGVFINSSAIVGHDCKIGKYVSIAPGVRILGKVEIGAYSYIGTNAIIMPGVRIGKMVRIGVGKIITEDIPDNSKII